MLDVERGPLRCPNGNREVAMFNIIKSMLGFQATPAADQTSSSDRFPDLPRLPDIPEERMTAALQDTLGRALSLVALSSRLNPELIEKRLS